MLDALTVFVALATVPFESRCPPDAHAAAQACRGDIACMTAAFDQFRIRCLPFWRYPVPIPILPSNVEPTPAVGPPRG